MAARITGLTELLAKLSALGGDVDSALEAGVDKVARRVKRDAKLLAPVDTGQLRNSIDYKIQKGGGKVQGIVYTNVEHAPYVEFGTGQAGEQGPAARPPGVSYRFDWAGAKAQPFLYPAATQNKDNVKKDVLSAVQNAIRGVAR